MSSSGKFNRPYKTTTVIYDVTISYESNLKTLTFEIEVDGFKELTNIASTYIGGNSTTYEALRSDIFEVCDIITCGFVSPAANGTFNESSVNYKNFTAFLPNMKQYVLSQAHAQGTYVVLSVAGMSEYESVMETICASDALINTFVSNIVGLINEYGFDGVDIDWEIPSNGALFTKLMSKLYTAVKANNPNHLVTAAIGGGTEQPAKYDLSNSIQYIDYINMMTYNMSTTSGYHHTPLYTSKNANNLLNDVAKTLTGCSIEESVAYYVSKNVTSSKIIIGSGFYGIIQNRTVINGQWTSNSNVSYTVIKNNYLTDSNYAQYYDENSQAPYLISADRLTFISYENATSIKAKCNYAIENGLAGIFAWQYGLDDGDLLNAFKEGLSK